MLQKLRPNIFNLPLSLIPTIAYLITNTAIPIIATFSLILFFPPIGFYLNIVQDINTFFNTVQSFGENPTIGIQRDSILGIFSPVLITASVLNFIITYILASFLTGTKIRFAIFLTLTIILNLLHIFLWNPFSAGYY